MNSQERQKNIFVLYKMAKYLEKSSEQNAAEILYLEAAKQADEYLPADSELRGKILIGCIDFFTKLGRDHDSDLMQKRLQLIANVLLDKVTQSQSLSD